MELLKIAINAALKAGLAILDIYYKADYETEYKEDRSPLTLADKNAHKTIIKILEKTNFPVLSEEGKEIPYEKRCKWDKFWLVDPLDGTKEFIKRNGEFTANIAFVESGKPVIGVVFVPVTSILYFATDNTGSRKIKITDFDINFENIINESISLPLPAISRNFTVVGSRSHMNEDTQLFIEKLQSQHGRIEFISAGSSLKFCLIAEGGADIYPRFAPTMEWDTAAGHAIALFAGKNTFLHNHKEELTYNKQNLLNPWFIVQ